MVIWEAAGAGGLAEVERPVGQGPGLLDAQRWRWPDAPDLRL
jgi:hypothetical protein